MHNGRTIEELIQLVQRIDEERGTHPKDAHALAHPRDMESSPSARSSQDQTEPAWLAVFR
jgi:hypothetical protein